MKRLLLLFFTIYAVSFLSLMLVYGLISISMLWIVNKMGFFYASVSINIYVFKAVFSSTFIPAITFGSIITGMCCIILYKALRKQQHLRIGHFITIFKSFLLLTAFFCIGYYLVILMIVGSGNSGLLMIMPYIRTMGRLFDYGLPVMWLSIACYWVAKYESKFLNGEEEWMLR